MQSPPHAAWLAMVRDLLAIRQHEIVPHFADAAERRARADGDVISARWRGSDGRTLHLLANAGAHDVQCPIRDLRPTGRADLGRRAAERLPPWSVYLVGCGGVMPPAIPLATYRLQLSAQFGFAACRGAGALSASAWHQPSLCLAVSEVAARQHPRLRHRRPQSARSGAWRRGGICRTVRGARQRRHGPDPRFRAQPHGHRPLRQCVVARRARIRPGIAVCRDLRHRLGPAAVPHATPACCCRSSASPMAAPSKTARSCCGSTPRKAASRPGISTIGCRSGSIAIATSSHTAVRAAGAERQPRRTRAPAVPSGAARRRASDAPAFKAALAAVDGGAELIEAGLHVYRANPGDPRSVASAASPA